MEQAVKLRRLGIRHPHSRLILGQPRNRSRQLAVQQPACLSFPRIIVHYNQHFISKTSRPFHKDGLFSRLG